MPVSNLEEFEQSIGLEPGTIAGAIQSEDDVTLSIPDGMVLKNEEELQQRETNLTKSRFEEGKKAAVEILVKEAKQTYGLDFEGKSFDGLMTAYKTSIEAESKIEPNKKVQTLTQERDQAVSNITSIQEKYTALENEFKGYKQKAAIDEYSMNILNSAIPEGAKTTIGMKQIKTLWDAEVKVGIDEEGNKVMYNGDKVIKNETTFEPISPSVKAQEFITQFIANPTGGRGGSDSPSGGSSGNDYDSFVEEMAEKGINIGSVEFNDEQHKRISNGTLKV